MVICGLKLKIKIRNNLNKKNSNEKKQDGSSVFFMPRVDMHRTVSNATRVPQSSNQAELYIYQLFMLGS